jgi:hypothetical protein
VPVYTWDGEKWTTLGGAIGSTGASDAIPAPDTTAGAAGSSTLWARGDHSHPALAAPYVRYDATQTLTTPQQQQATTNIVAVSGNPQSLTVPQQQQARQNIYAPPFDAMAYGGLQINGGMEVSQERGSSGTTANNTFICDGWPLFFNGTMAVTGAQITTPYFSGFPSWSFVSVQTAQPSLAAGDYVFIRQSIEGLRTAKLSWGTANAQPITLSFWSSHHRAGIYGGVIRNAANNRTYAFTYTQAVADVAQYNSIAIPGDTTGTWASDNTTGLQVLFAVGVGSTFTAPSANNWLAGNYFTGPGQLNAVAATSDIFRLTGVIVLPGNEAPSAARSPFVMRPLPQELAVCQRYFERQMGTHTHYINGAGSWGGDPISFKVEKRGAPTVTPLNATAANASGLTVGSISVWGFNWTTSITTPGGAFVSFDWWADARL